MRHLKSVIGLLCTIALSGCGMTTPNIQDLGSNGPEYLDENDIVNQVKCELHLGVQKAFAGYADMKTFSEQKHLPFNNYSIDWLNKWGAAVTLDLTVDEKGALAPGLTFTSPFQEASQMVSIGVGASVSSEASRREQIQFTYGFADLQKEGHVDTCSDAHGVQIHSDLKISDFIYNKAILSTIPGTIDHGGAPVPATGNHFPYSTFSDQVSFIVAESGNATPGFKLVRFSVNPSSPFASATRTKTQNIIITLGAQTGDSTKDSPAKLSDETVAAHNAQVTGQEAGQAVVNALRGLGLSVP